MNADQLDADLAPLLIAARSLGAHSLVLFGSATVVPLRRTRDVDLHLIVRRMEQDGDRAITEAAAAAAQALAGRRPWQVEKRHGPFKPSPDASPLLQLHLVVDDATSLAQTSRLVLLHRATTGRKLLGEGPSLQWQPALATGLTEARRELTRWRDAVSSRTIPFRRWDLDSAPRLVEERAPADDAWDLRCLLQAAARSSDLHYLPVARLGPRLAAEAMAAWRPLVEEHVHRNWRQLADGWHRVAAQADAILHSRLRDLDRRK